MTSIGKYCSILFQKKDKSNDCNGNDQPMNLTNQCTIRGQTIIEHIIENMIDSQEQLGNSTKLMPRIGLWWLDSIGVNPSLCKGH